MDWKTHLDETLTEPLDESLLATAAVGAAAGRMFLNGGAYRPWWNGGGGISRGENELVKKHGTDTGYGVGDSIKHAIFGKSGNEKYDEVEAAKNKEQRSQWKADTTPGTPTDKLAAVREHQIAPEHKAYVNHAKEVLKQAAIVGNDKETDPNGYESPTMQQAAQSYVRGLLVHKGVIPDEHNDFHVSDIGVNEEGKLTANYRDGYRGQIGLKKVWE